MLELYEMHSYNNMAKKKYVTVSCQTTMTALSPIYLLTPRTLNKDFKQIYSLS